MNIEGRTVWQHAAGDRDHRHDHICREWNVILSGGERHLKDEMKQGDIVVLKLGRTTLLAIGILGKYEWCAEFNDIDGWSLGHTRRVSWLWWADTPEKYPDWTFNRGTTNRLKRSSRIFNQRIGPFLAGVNDSVDWNEIRSFEFPEVHDLEAEAIATYLFKQGLPGDAIRSLLDYHGSFSQMANWYSDVWRWASEHETVCHLVVPLLKVLGWTPQKIALEFSGVDVALFDRMPREDKNVAVVVEAKKVHKACLRAITQARDYAKRYRNCSRIIVTDGLRYGIYLRGGPEWSDKPKPYAYLNVIRPRASYPIYAPIYEDLKGAREAIYAMTPHYIQQQEYL